MKYKVDKITTFEVEAESEEAALLWARAFVQYPPGGGNSDGSYGHVVAQRTERHDFIKELDALVGRIKERERHARLSLITYTSQNQTERELALKGRILDLKGELQIVEGSADYWHDRAIELATQLGVEA